MSIQRMGLSFALIWLLASSAVTGKAEPNPSADPVGFELHPDLEISLFAQEPDIVDPVALSFDGFGRLYVVEMRDFPYGFGLNRQPGGTVRLLEDTDGDGRMDHSYLFADHLSFPTSVAAWEDGILVAAPPEILYLKDTNGDHKADVREVVLSGFNLGVTDSNVNGLRWGLDNWMHGVNGGNDGRLRAFRGQGKAVPLKHRDFRFRPDTGALELTAHTGGGFGLVFDDWGRSFTTYNIDHIQQRVADANLFNRFPGLPSFGTTHSISDHGDMARIYPVSVAQTRPNHPEQAGYFSAAGGMGFVGHSGWPANLPGSVLVCDVVGNLVHRDRLVANGPIFTAARFPEEQIQEFLASQDINFRPVGLEPGPDGALYLIDMQRDVIEHPDYIPARMREKINLRAGEDRGRIYRLAPKGWNKTRELPGSASSRQRLVMLGSSNQWTRLTAQRLLVTHPEDGLVPDLQRLAQTGDTPLVRLHALWTLNGWGKLDNATLVVGLEDAHSGVRENALRILRLRPMPDPLPVKVIEGLRDDDVMVRFQAALTIGFLPDTIEVASSVREALRRDHSHTWMRRALLAGLRSSEEQVLTGLLTDKTFVSRSEETRLSAVRELAALAGARGIGFSKVLEHGADDRLAEAWRLEILEGLHEGLHRSKAKVSLKPTDRVSINRLVRTKSPRLLASAWRLQLLLGVPETEEQKASLAKAIEIALDHKVILNERIAAIQLIDVGDPSGAVPVLLGLLGGRESSAIQEAAWERLREHRELEVGQGLVQTWSSLSPSLRAPVLNRLVYHSSFHRALLEGLEQGFLQVGELNLDLEHRRELLRESAPEIRRRASRFMSDEEYSNRSEVVVQWLGKLPEQGDASQGRAIFERICATCHKSGNLGHAVGPDLTGMNHRSVEDLLSNILDPNMAMNPAFVSYTAILRDDEEESGILTGESGDSVILLQAQGRKVEVARGDMRQLRANGRSLMPEGLEAGLTPQNLRDLIAFLQGP